VTYEWPRRLSAAARPAAIATVAIGIEWIRVLAMARPDQTSAALVLGGASLCALAIPFSRESLGLAGGRWALRVVGALALTAVLLLPAALRWHGGGPLTGFVAFGAIIVASGEELAFRGALYAALDEVGGPALAVAGSSLAFTAAHVISHPLEFLPAVAAAGLLLGLWRWACRDLVAPVIAHAAADLAL
jgi:membrane protease YdiL (CAAX protease family)